MRNIFPIFLTLISLQIVLFNSCCTDDDKPIETNWGQEWARDTVRESFSTCLVNGEPWETCVKLGEETSGSITTKVLISFVESCFVEDNPSSVIEFDLKFIPEGAVSVDLGSYNTGSFYEPNIFEFAKEQKTQGDSSGYICFYIGSVPQTLSGSYAFKGYHDSLGYVNITSGKFYNLEIK